MKPLEERFWEKVDRRGPDDCWPWTGSKTTDGYGNLGVNGKIKLAHRVAWEATYGPIPAGQCVCHTCDNPPCCNPDHLWLGTHADNMQDMLKKGRGNKKAGSQPGSTNGQALLNERAVKEIRWFRYTYGYSYQRLARLFNVNKATIQAVVTGRHWKHVR